MDTLVPLVVIGLFGAVIISIGAATIPKEHRANVLRILFLAFAFRLTAAVIFNIAHETRIFHEDSDGYEWIGMRLADYWNGNGPPLDMRIGREQNYGFYYVAGALYYVFGLFAPVVAYFNSLLGTLVVLLVYRLATQFFHTRIARRAALLTAFMPSMILWSATALKDTLMSFLILLSLSGCISLKKKPTLGAILLTLTPVVAMQPIRFYMTYFLIFAIFTSLLLDSGLNIVKGAYKPMLVAAVFIGLLSVVGLSSRLQNGAEFLDLKTVSNFRRGMATTAASGFSADVDISSPAGAVAFLPLGVATLMLSPFPWQFTSVRSLFAAPEMILWWFLIPSLLRGLRFSVKHVWRSTSPLLLFGLTLTLAYSLVHGNIGSGFRQRAQIFVILFIFAALGEYLKKCERVGITDTTLLLVPGTVARA